MSFPVPLPSTFMPLPLAIMIPFMGIQSGVMAQQFGMNFQYGKRKISAMSNEEFNKLTPEQMQADFSNQITGMIPTFEKSLQEMRPFQRMIFIEMIAAFKEAVQLGLDVAGAGLGIVPPDQGEGKPDTKHSFLSPIQQRAHIRHGHRQEIEDRYGKQEEETTSTPIPTEKVITLKYQWTDLNKVIRNVSMSLTEARHKVHILAIEHNIKNLLFLKTTAGTQAANRLKRQLLAYRNAFKNKFGYWV